MTTTSADGARRCIVHEDPAERRESNYIAQVDLAPFDMLGQHEQVWLHDLGGGTYALACIPFMVYGLALGAVVALDSRGMVADLLRPAGHRVLRLMLDQGQQADRLAGTVAEVQACVSAAGLRSEWHGPRYIAVDLPPGSEPRPVFDVMGRIVDQGRGSWEWAHARPFKAAEPVAPGRSRGGTSAAGHA